MKLLVVEPINSTDFIDEISYSTRFSLSFSIWAKFADISSFFGELFGQKHLWGEGGGICFSVDESGAIIDLSPRNCLRELLVSRPLKGSVREYYFFAVDCGIFRNSKPQMFENRTSPEIKSNSAQENGF
jgi:hypothetical protein